MKVRTRWIIALSSLCIVYIVMQVWPYQKRSVASSFITQDRPLVIAHGGAKQLFPENTIYAFEQVYAMGVDGVEVDVRKSADDILLSIHDANIAHYTKNKGKVSQYTYDELTLFNFAYFFQNEHNQYIYRNVDARLQKKLVPMRIDHMFSQFNDNLFYILEVKENGSEGVKTAKLLYEMILKYGLQKRACIASFDYSVMEYLNAIENRQVPIVMDEENTKEFVKANLGGYNRFVSYTMDGLMLPLKAKGIPLNEAYLIEKIKAQYMFVFYWTINKIEDMQVLIENKATGIITDRPDILLTLLSK